MSRKFTLRSFFSEDDGSGSLARLGTAAVIVASITWVSIVLYRTGRIPDQIGSLGVYTSTIVTALYTGNKFATALGQRNGK